MRTVRVGSTVYTADYVVPYVVDYMPAGAHLSSLELKFPRHPRHRRRHPPHSFLKVVSRGVAPLDFLRRVGVRVIPVSTEIRGCTVTVTVTVYYMYNRCYLLAACLRNKLTYFPRIRRVRN